MITNDLLIIRGMSYADTKVVMQEWTDLYYDQLSSDMKFEISSDSSDIHTVRPNQRLGDDLFFFLVNYVHHFITSKELKADIEGFTTGDDTPQIKGKRLLVYVSKHDKEYDNVSVITENNEVFKIDFGGKISTEGRERDFHSPDKANLSPIESITPRKTNTPKKSATAETQGRYSTQSILFMGIIFALTILCLILFSCKGTYVSQAIHCEQKGDYATAISYWDKVIKNDPNDAVAYYNRGYDKNQLGLFAQAEADYDKAIENDSAYLAAYVDRAFVHIRQDNSRAALHDANKALALKYWRSDGSFAKLVINPEYRSALSSKNPPDPQHSVYDILARRGDAYYGLDSLEQAFADYSRCIDANAGADWGYYKRGFIHYRMGQYDEARADWQAAVSLGGGTETAQYAQKALDNMENEG